MHDAQCTLHNELYSSDGIKKMWSGTISNIASFFAMLQSLLSPLRALSSSMHYNLHSTLSKMLVIYPHDNSRICVVLLRTKETSSSSSSSFPPPHPHLILISLYIPRYHAYTLPCVAPTLAQRVRGAVCAHVFFGWGVKSVWVRVAPTTPLGLALVVRTLGDELV